MQDVKKVVDTIIQYAQDRFDTPGFVFGGYVYTIDEAREAMMQTASAYIEEQYRGDAEAYADAVKECACDIAQRG